MRKAENFSEWYNEMIERANLSDKRYPIKGMNVWTPYGWSIMRHIDERIRLEMAMTGHQEVNFPLLIPETEFQKEAQHIKGFNQEVYWVTHAGENELDVRLLLRPTSETAMYPMFSLWVRSHTDLPLKVFQLVNTFRYETKQTRSFIRVREIHFFESHTCHVDFEDAERQIREDLEIAERFAKSLCLPFVLCKRPEWDKFAGAYYTIGIDTVMPNGKTLQLGSIHQYMDNFAVPYNITYEDEGGEHRKVHQTTYGMSERLVGAIIGVHGDDKGLVLPPAVAPIQVVIVPVLAKGKVEEVSKEADRLMDELKGAGLRVTVDHRDMRPGAKYYDWELKGVPLRVEVGMRDIEAGKVVVSRRDTGEKCDVQRGEMLARVQELLDKVASTLLERAEAIMRDSIKDINDIAEIDDNRLYKLYWCGSEDCGHRMEDEGEVAILGEPEGESGSGQCAACGAPASKVLYASRNF